MLESGDERREERRVDDEPLSRDASLARGLESRAEESGLEPEWEERVAQDERGLGSGADKKGTTYCLMSAEGSSTAGSFPPSSIVQGIRFSVAESATWTR